jgi:hypothetical protein
MSPLPGDDAGMLVVAIELLNPSAQTGHLTSLAPTAPSGKVETLIW